MKKSLTAMAAAFVIISACEIYAANFLTSTEHDPVIIGQKGEISIGKSTDRQLRSQYRVSSDEYLNQRINAIGQRLAAHSSRKNMKYTFTVLDAELVNAFAAPGGYIYITTGILKRLQSEDEIAAVLSHEIDHVVHRHSLKALQRRMIVVLGLNIAAAYFGDAGSLSQALILKASEISASLLLLKNSRVNELQADNEGVKIMHAAGYNTRGMIELQEMFLNMSRGKKPPAIISTHPPSQERIDAIKKAIAKMK